MNIEKNLQMLVKEQEAYDNNRSVSFYQNTYHKFAEFYIDKLLISPSKNTNAEKLLNHIDVILKYTGAYSQDGSHINLCTIKKIFLINLVKI